MLKIHRLHGTLAYLAVALAVITLTHCGGGGGSSSSNTPPPQQQPVAISTSPASASLSLGQTQQFTATVSNSSNTAVTWQVNNTTGGSSQAGTISASGLYTAPNALPNPAQVTITAVSQADTTKTSSATVTVTSSVSVSPVGPANPTVPAGGTEQFTATTSGDPGSLGVTWSVNGTAGGDSTNGTITAKGLYTAPAFPPAGGTVTISAASVADSSKSVSTTATISIANASLSGSYAFSLNGGAPGGGIESVAGSFTADGQGNLKSGLEDLNSPIHLLTNAAFAGTYSIGADGRGTATITNSQGTFTFRFVMVSTQHGLITEFDGTATIAGTFDRQDTTAFSNSALQGGYVFGFTGSDTAGNPVASAGQLTADGAGGIKSGIEDINDNGAVSASQPFTGTYTIASSGRGTASFTGAAGTTNYAFYVISANQVDYVDIDAAEAVGGIAYKQTSSAYSNASLSGNFFFYFASEVLAGQTGGKNGVPSVAAGLLVADGSGNFKSSSTEDQIVGNVGLEGLPLTGQYTIAPNGRGAGTLTVNVAGAPISFTVTFYMVSSSSGIIMETLASSSPVNLGSMIAQQSTSFLNASLNGRYGFSLQGAQFKLLGPLTDVGQITADGNGNLSATEDVDTAGQLTAGAQATGKYGPDNTGHPSASLGTSSFLMYVVSPSQIFFVDNSNTGIREGFAELQY